MFVSTEELFAKFEELSKKYEALKAQETSAPKATNGKKNQQVQVPDPHRYYTFNFNFGPRVWGKVPRQQYEVAALIVTYLKSDVEYTEKEVFDTIYAQYAQYPSLFNSKQDAAYLFKYYRGVGDPVLNYIRRGFVVQIDK